MNLDYGLIFLFTGLHIRKKYSWNFMKSWLQSQHLYLKNTFKIQEGVGMW